MESLSAKQVREIKDLYKDVHKVEELIEDGAEINEFFDSLTEEEKKNIFQKIKDAFKPKPITVKTSDGTTLTIGPGHENYKGIKSGKVTTYSINSSGAGNRTYNITKDKNNYSAVETDDSINKRKELNQKVDDENKRIIELEAKKKKELEAKAKEKLEKEKREAERQKLLKQPIDKEAARIESGYYEKPEPAYKSRITGAERAQQIAKDRIASGKTIDQVKAENEAKMKANASALNKDFQLMKKGEITKQEFVKKYPKSNTAKDFNARKLPPKVTDYSSYDPYETVLGYVLSEGHADTVEEAHYVMMQMDAETIQDIVEKVGIFKDPKLNKMYPNQPKMTYKGKQTLPYMDDPTIYRGNKVVYKPKNTGRRIFGDPTGELQKNSDYKDFF